MDKNWWRFAVGLLIGALAPSLIAWGAMSADIKHNSTEIDKRVCITTFEEYKRGAIDTLEEIRKSLIRIEEKIDSR